MADYQSMYRKLFNSITDAVNILQKAQAEAEELFISQRGDNITALEPEREE